MALERPRRIVILTNGAIFRSPVLQFLASLAEKTNMSPGKNQSLPKTWLWGSKDHFRELKSGVFLDSGFRLHLKLFIRRHADQQSHDGERDRLKPGVNILNGKKRDGNDLLKDSSYHNNGARQVRLKHIVISI